MPLLVVPAFALVIIAREESELASETLAFYVWAVMAPISALAVAILASGAISGEATIISDSILSRSVTRTEREELLITWLDDFGQRLPGESPRRPVTDARHLDRLIGVGELR